ncbi:MAG: amino acid adenylation domain-containing protein, partial [Acidobacteriota bacterium]
MTAILQRLAKLSPAKRKLLEQKLAARGGLVDAVPRRPADLETLPLSSAQERFCFLDQLTTEPAAFTILSAVRLEGALDVQALGQSLNEVVCRHEVLRTVFRTDEHPPRQLVLPAAALPIRQIDLTAVPATHQLAEVERLAMALTGRRFDLQNGPLIRVVLVRLRARLHVLLRAVHHIVSDGVSDAIFFRELVTAYGAFALGDGVRLPAVELQYADVALWQRQRFADGALEPHLRYWSGQLADPPSPLPLPTDRPRPAIQSLRSAVEIRALPPAVAAAVKSLGERLGATLFMVLLAAYKVLLYRWTGRRDLLVGSPMSSRDRRELEAVIGCLVNTLVLRTRLDDTQSFQDLLRQIRRTTLDAYGHQDLPFEEIVNALEVERSSSHTPLYQVALAQQPGRMPALELPDLRFSTLDIGTGGVECDQVVFFEEVAEGLTIRLVYSIALFDRSTAARCLAHFTTLLEAVAARKLASLAELPWMSPAERQQVTAEWNSTGAVSHDETTVLQRVESAAARRPEAIALVSGAQALTYGALNRRAAQLAGRLVRAGVGAEARVGLCLERSIEMAVSQLAVLKAGAAYVSLDPSHPQDRLDFMLGDSGVEVVLGHRLSQGSLPQAMVRFLGLDADSVADGMPGESTEAAAGRAAPDNLVYVIYTSGSTGRPKGVAVSHRSLSNLTAWHAHAYGLASGTRVAQVAGPGFDASVWEIWACLTTGGCLVFMPAEIRSDPTAVVGWLAEQRIEESFLPTPLLEAVAREPWPSRVPLRALLTGGDRLHRGALGSALPGALFNHYGPTENTVVATGGRVIYGEDLRQVAAEPSIGRPITNVQTLIVDRALRPVPIGVAGELTIGGLQVGRGYLGRPALTARCFVPDPFSVVAGGRLYRTGDWVRWSTAGEIDFLQRIDHQVKVRGFRIELGEIESVLLEQRGVAQAAVLAPETASGARYLAAYVAAGGEEAPASTELASALRARLPEYMVPTVWTLLEDLPLTPNGKVDRRALSVPPAEVEPGAPEEPRSPTEQGVAAIFAQVLGRQRVGLHEDFFASGGHSLLATRLVARLERAFGVDVGLRQAFEDPTVAGLSRRIEAVLQSGAGLGRPALRRSDRGQNAPLSYAQERLWFIDRLEPANQAYNLVLAVRLRGLLEIALLTWSLAEIVRRHEILRTRYELRNGKAQQVSDPSVTVRLPVIDLSRLSRLQRRQAQEDIAAYARRPFDLSCGPVYRAFVVRASRSSHVLLAAMHHIATDGWSMGVLVKELSDLYSAKLSDEPVDRPPLALQYRDYAVWQRAWLQGEILERHLEYWRQRLAEAGDVLELVTDRPRSVARGQRGASVPIALPKVLDEQLSDLCGRFGATPFMTLITGLYALLWRYSGASTIQLGTPVAGRSAVETENLIGCFVNTLVLRTEIRSADSFEVLLRQVREAALGAYSHQDAPFEKVVEALNLTRDLSRTPLFQVMFVLQSTEPLALELSELRWELEPIERTTAQFDLTFELQPSATGVSGALHFDRDLFDRTTVQRMAWHYRALLAGAAASPDARVSELPLMDSAERHQLFREWTATSASETPGWCLHQIFAARVVTGPDAVAVVHGDRQLSYGEIDRRASHLARRLQRRGIGPEVGVGLYIERSPELVISILGILRAGGAYVPLDPSYPSDRLAFLLEDSRVPVLLTTQNLVTELPPGHPEVLYVDGAWVPEREEAPRPASQASPDNLAYVIYTSGSTGRPKGSLIRHRQVARLFAASDGFDFGERDVWTLFHSYAFDFSVWEIWGALLYGGRLVIVPRDVSRSPRDFHALLARQRVTVLNQTPSAFRQLVGVENVVSAADRRLALRYVVFGGEALDLADLAPWIERRGDERPLLVNMYGITETTVHVTFRPVRMDDLGRSHRSPLGAPLSDLQVHLADARLRRVPIGVAGEILVAGGGLGGGYLGRPGLTAERFVPDPWSGRAGLRLYRSGDLGRRRGDADLDYLGRIDQQVKVRGFRIELGEIEAAVREETAVDAAVAVLRPDSPGGPGLVLYVVPRAGETLQPAQLREQLKKRLPEYMLPAAISLLDRLPLTAHGKIDRRALPAPAAQVSAGSRPDSMADQGLLARDLASIWCEVLAVEAIGIDDNFFDLGGHSLLVVELQSRILRRLDRDVPIVDFFRYPTIRSLVDHLRQGSGKQTPALARSASSKAQPVGDIALIGMVGRFPGADDLDSFWRNLTRGVESISFFTEDELESSPLHLDASHPSFVKAGGVVDGIELFDADFFGYSPREAELMDPQHRLFLECAWQALELAGYDASAYSGRVGVYAGSGLNSYLQANLLSDPNLPQVAGTYQLLIGNDKDFLPTRVSYKLGLRGPSINVQTACSTSLVATHLACRALHNGECDMALAGGVTLRVPQKSGYLYEPSMILSPDGHCRVFDADARGTVGGSGVGIVVLKPLAVAMADGDTIHAVIKGSAINNDGDAKVGYTAPSVVGQSQVITDALAAAGVPAETVSFVEAHGTGTEVGDPIELTALRQAFEAASDEGGVGHHRCAVGSVKSNLGHLDTAAGVAGLIKTALALKHHQIPPSLHFESPNPKLGLDDAPFFVPTETLHWPKRENPRRAGVSSFGIGGTNAHLVLEEAPPRPASSASRPMQLLTLSARTEAGLERLTQSLADHLSATPQLPLADVAYTLHNGRRGFEHRRALVCGDLRDAAVAFGDRDPQRLLDGRRPTHDPQPVFLFPGQGAQYAGMGAELYATEPVFRRWVDRCYEIVDEELRGEMRKVLAPTSEARDMAHTMLRETRLSQPALFTVEYSLAQLWIEWGVEPLAMFGHSVGEWVAACLAGVLTLEEALRIVCLRGQLMQSMPAGAMLAVSLPASEIETWLDHSLALAAINGPRACVVAGPDGAIEALERRLDDGSIDHRQLQTSHAFHSAMMDAAVEPFERQLERIELRAPKIPFLSNVTGTWIEAGQATDPAYWASHLRHTVRCAEGLAELLRDPDRVFLELGPGRALSTLLRQQAADRLVVASLPPAKTTRTDSELLLRSLGRLWLTGVEVDWPAFYAAEQRHRLPLPTYPFERRRHWVEPQKHLVASAAKGRKERVAEWFYLPSWKRGRRLPTPQAIEQGDGGPWLLFQDRSGVGASLASRLREQGQRVVSVEPGEGYHRLEDALYALDPADPESYLRLIRDLSAAELLPERIVHMWAVDRLPTDETASGTEGNAAFERSQRTGFYSLLALAQAWSSEADERRVELSVVASGLHAIELGDCSEPEKATLLGLLRVVPQECPMIACRSIDLDGPANWRQPSVFARLQAELQGPIADPVVALRGTSRWIESFEPLPLEAPQDASTGLRRGGVYLITGGLGKIGLLFARHMAETVQARLVLVGRSPFPLPSKWSEWLAKNGNDDPVSQRIRTLRELEEAGAEVWVASADMADPGAAQEVVDGTVARFGALHGVIHAAGVVGERAFHPLA